MGLGLMGKPCHAWVGAWHDAWPGAWVAGGGAWHGAWVVGGGDDVGDVGGGWDKFSSTLKQLNTRKIN